VRTYSAHGGLEHFISWESKDRQVLFGFCRLRLCADAGSVFGELVGAALIRELHVYGRTLAVGESVDGASQHVGVGQRLLAEAERLAFAAKHHMIAVISGVGVRGYYEKRGYALMPGHGEFMMKNIYKAPLTVLFQPVAIIIMILVIAFLVY
jgi:elongator complex protein 3